MPKALVIDHGMYVEVARNLALAGYEVGYFSSWHNSFPQSREMMIGAGIEGVTRVDEPLRAMGETAPDLVVIPDLYLHDYEYAARRMGIPTVGSGAGQRIETDRWHLKELLAENELDVIHSVLIQGVEETWKYLQEHPDTYVKVSTYRGDMETHPAKDWLTEYHDLRKNVGELGHSMQFIVEDPIPDALEVGIDGWFCGGELLTPFLVGCEIKDTGYVGYVCDNASRLPPEAQAVLKVLGQHFADKSYANFFSNEMRVLPNGQTFMTDATCRIPSPPGGVLMAACQNFGDVVKGLALDNPVPPDFGDADYLAELVLKSSWLPAGSPTGHFLKVDFPKSMREQYAFHNYMMLDGKVWIAPYGSLEEFGSALGAGSLEGSLGTAKMAAEKADAYKLEFEADALGKAKETMATAAKMGYAP